MNNNEIELTAELCHELNRAYCASLGDHSQLPWRKAPQWQKDSAMNGVKFHLDHPNSRPEDSHNNWLKEKKATGWKFGPVKDADKKTHPCCIPYDQLSDEQKFKDLLFLTAVRASENMARDQAGSEK